MPEEPLLYHEQELLHQIARGDERCFRILFDRYRDRLYYYTLQITSSPQLSEDIVQETFLKIWLRRDQLQGITHFNAYIFRIAKNMVFTGLRRKALEAAVLAGGSVTPETDVLPDEQLHFKQIKSLLQQATDALPSRQRDVYVLRRDEGRSIREIADKMGISDITVKRHLTEAQKTLRQVLKENFPEGAAILVIIFGLLSH